MFHIYPKALLASALRSNPGLLHKIWEALNELRPSSILGEGRVYGGGLHKLEPNELGNVDAASIVDFIPEISQGSYHANARCTKFGGA